MTDPLMHVSLEEHVLCLKKQSIRRSTCWVQRSLEKVHPTSRMLSLDCFKRPEIGSL
jgi:hypothetical protein